MGSSVLLARWVDSLRCSPCVGCDCSFQAETVISMRADRAESPGRLAALGNASLSAASWSPMPTAGVVSASPMSLRAALLMHTTVLSCMFHDHSAWIGWPADWNDAMMRQGSSPRRVAFHCTDSRGMRAATSVRSMSSAKVRTRDSFGARTRRNCSIA